MLLGHPQHAHACALHESQRWYERVRDQTPERIPGGPLYFSWQAVGPPPGQSRRGGTARQMSKWRRSSIPGSFGSPRDAAGSAAAGAAYCSATPFPLAGGGDPSAREPRPPNLRREELDEPLLYPTVRWRKYRRNSEARRV